MRLVLSWVTLAALFPAASQAFGTPRPSRRSSPRSLVALGSSTAATEQQQQEENAVLSNNVENLSLTRRMFQKVPNNKNNNQVGGAGGTSSVAALERAEANWQRLKDMPDIDYADDSKVLLNGDAKSKPPFITQDGAQGNPKCWQALQEIATTSKSVDFDVVVCGGTLGIFYAAYLQLAGHDVCVVEGGKLQGRDQEWNISREELQELVDLGILTKDEVEQVITTEFPACRSGFKNKEVTPLQDGYFVNGIGYECITPDVLNCGVAPSKLLEIVKQRFLDNGGSLRELTRLQGICISEQWGAALDTKSQDKDESILTSRLVLDCMGNASPISAQQRQGLKPDGICAVVGSCAGGYDPETNTIGDIIYTHTPIQTTPQNGSNQYFWEAFPVGIGRNGQTKSDVKTTYMFTYMDAHPDRPSLEQLFEDYWSLLPIYQPSIQNVEEDLDIKRILCATFPTFRDSPLPPAHSRMVAVGDASGIQSPLSFGGFGAVTRHLGRVGGALSQALDTGCLHKDDLALINAYQPNLSAAWMFQKAMSVKMSAKDNVDPNFVNRLLAVNFEQMNELGPRVIKPFLQDVIRFDGLVLSLAKSFVADPTFMPQIISTVGVVELAKWLGHVGNMALYTALDMAVSPVLAPFVEGSKSMSPRERFQWQRRMEAWKFGSGRDYTLPPKDDA